jgi:hypothetical protein
MKNGFAVLVLVAGLGFAHGCATYQLTIPDSHPADINYREKTMHAFLWGTWYDPQVFAADCGREAINDVQIKRNFLHDLASVVTLGIWMPIEVNFRCASARIREGEPIRPR